VVEAAALYAAYALFSAAHDLPIWIPGWAHRDHFSFFTGVLVPADCGCEDRRNIIRKGSFGKGEKSMRKRLDKDSPARFLLIFLSLFAVFYYFNILFFGITSPGNHYIAFFDQHLNYIRALRHFLLRAAAQVLGWFGYTAITSDTELLVVGRGVIKLVYSCLGLGIMSFFTAFVIAFPKKLKSKGIFLICGLVIFQALNILRFVVLALFWKGTKGLILDHHTIFNIIIYVLIGITIYFWVKHDDRKPADNAKQN
jgi:exosortase/archaeosortase family protein